MKARESQIGGKHYVSLGVQPWDAMRSWMTDGSKGGSGIQTDFMGWMLSTDNTLKNVQERLAKVEGEQERMKAEYRRGQELIQERLAILEAERKRN